MNSNNNKSSAVSAPMLTAEAAVLFLEGINLMLSQWTALQMAMLNKWGGAPSDLTQQLAIELFSRLTQSNEKVYIEDVEDFLDDVMLSFETQIEDGSIEEIASNLMHMHEGCLGGDFSLIKRLKAREPPKGAVTHVLKDNSDSDSDDASDDNEINGGGSSMMVVDAPKFESSVSNIEMKTDGSKPQSAEAEDGWTVVASKRSKGRRN